MSALHQTQHDRKFLLSVAIEFDILEAVGECPQSPLDLVEELPYTYNQIKFSVQLLREAGVIYRVPGTHLMALVDL